MPPILKVLGLLCLLFITVKANSTRDKAGIYIPAKPETVILNDKYETIYPGPADLGIVFSNAFRQVIEGIGTTIHAAVDYMVRLFGR